jgi:hypothetical protein
MLTLSPVAEGLHQVLGSHPTLVLWRKETFHGRTLHVMDTTRQRILCLLKQGMVTYKPVAEGTVPAGGGVDGRTGLRQTKGYVLEDPAGRLAIVIPKFGMPDALAIRLWVVDPGTSDLLGQIDLGRSEREIVMTWATSRGEPVMKVNRLLNRTSSYENPISDRDGHEVGLIRKSKWAFRDIWELDLKPGSDHLFCVIFSAIWECEILPRGAV